MIKLLGKKLGMTRIFDKDSKHIAVTLIHIEPNKILFIKNKEKDGYSAVQIGNGNKKYISKPIAGHIKKSNTKSIEKISEFKVNESDLKKYKIGDLLTLEQLKIGNKIDIVAISKGKGFAGVMKRHGFSGMPASHGHEKQRIPGSIGCRYPQRTVKGKRMAGHMGVEKNTIKNLKIIDIDIKNNILAVKGSVPGNKKTIIELILR